MCMYDGLADIFHKMDNHWSALTPACFTLHVQIDSIQYLYLLSLPSHAPLVAW